MVTSVKEIQNVIFVLSNGTEQARLGEKGRALAAIPCQAGTVLKGTV